LMLTGRQREFLSKLVAMCRGSTHPPHYSSLARSLRVSKWSAYDMMRALESKGLVSRGYSQRTPGGRSSVFFFPTEHGMQAAEAADAHHGSDAEWWQAKERILAALRSRAAESYHRLVGELMESIPGRASPLAYCAEVAAAWFLAARDSKVMARVRRFAPAYRARLKALDASSQHALLRFFAEMISGAHLGDAAELSAESTR
jgi:DNA-binding MarR family transcriptional regulator